MDGDFRGRGVHEAARIAALGEGDESSRAKQRSAMRPNPRLRAADGRAERALRTGRDTLSVDWRETWSLIAADAYDRYMGRYSVLLAAQLSDLAGVRDGQRVLDVGCGPGRSRPSWWSASGPRPCRPSIRPSPSWQRRASAIRRSTCGGRRRGAAAVRGRRLRRGTRPARRPLHGGPERGRRGDAAGHAAGRRGRRVRLGPRRRSGPPERFLGGRDGLRPRGDRRVAADGPNEGDLARLFASAGLRDVDESALSVSLEHPTFEEWWSPFTARCRARGRLRGRASMPSQARALEGRCRELAPDPFRLDVVAWAARGLA